MLAFTFFQVYVCDATALTATGKTATVTADRTQKRRIASAQQQRRGELVGDSTLSMETHFIDETTVSCFY